MSDFNPILAKDFDISKVECGQMKTMPSGAKLVFLAYNGGPLYLQSPEMSVTFDPQTYEDGPNAKYSIKSSVNIQAGEDSKEFFDKMKEFDVRLAEIAQENSVEWFKKKNMSQDVVSSMLSETVRESTDSETGEVTGRYPPTFGFKVKKKDSKILCRCFNGSEPKPYPEIEFNNKEADNYKDFEKCIKKNTLVKGLLKCEFIWLSAGKFGCSWSAQQLRIKIPKGFDEYAFVESDDDEVEAERLGASNYVDTDSDEDGEVVSAKKE